MYVSYQWLFRVLFPLEELTGFPCPLKGGPYWDEMSAAQRASDKQAQLQVSLELGHCRPDVTKIYLGSQEQIALVFRFARGAKYGMSQ